jgi:hypothetical protein
MAKPLEDALDPLRVLYYGDGGTAKTTNIAHMADLGKIVVINAEGGLSVTALRKQSVNTANVEVWPDPGEKITFKGLEAECLRIREALNEDPSAYVGTAWDSLTELAAVLLEDVTAKEYERAVRTGAKRADMGEFFTDVGDYGVMAQQVRQLIRKFRDLPCHFSASCLERRDQDPDGKIIYRPSVIPSLYSDLHLWFGMVCHTVVATSENTGEEQYRGEFRPIGKYRGKDRHGVTPRILVNPTFDRLLSYFEGAITEADDPVMIEARTKAKSNKKDEVPANA